MPQHTPSSNGQQEPRLLLAAAEWFVMNNLRYLLRRAYRVVPVDSGPEAARQLVGAPPFDVAVLCATLPEMDGLGVLRHVRAASIQTPIMMLCDGGREDVLAAFSSGADDALANPYNPRELLARVEALLRRSPEAPTPPLESCRLGDVEINFVTYTARRGEEGIALTPLEFRVLHQLARRRGRVVSRDEFKREVWKMPEDVETRTMDRHVNALREKIEPDPREPRYIKTVFGVGYRLDGGEPSP